MLQTTLHARIADNMIVDNFSGDHRVVHTPTFEGTIPGPTLSLKPGDTLSINIFNDLPDNPKVQRMGFFPHDPYTINLHTHGLEVSPLGISDNIYRTMPPGSGKPYPVEVHIPADHPSGTYWYHTHKHGAVTFQLISGMAGFLIIKGGPGTLDALPEVAAATHFFTGMTIAMLVSAIIMAIAEWKTGYLWAPVVVLLAVVAATVLTERSIFPLNTQMSAGIKDPGELQTILAHWTGLNKVRVWMWTAEWAAMMAYFACRARSAKA